MPRRWCATVCPTLLGWGVGVVVLALFILDGVPFEWEWWVFVASIKCSGLGVL